MKPAYQPSDIEPHWYEVWEGSGSFRPEVNPDGEPFSIVIPPPNVTGALHMGHALNNTVVACLVAYLLLLHLTSLLSRIVSMALAVVWFVTIGLTRVFLGYHWLTDVVAGWLIGMSWALLCWVVERMLERRAGLKREKLEQANNS